MPHKCSIYTQFSENMTGGQRRVVEMFDDDLNELLERLVAHRNKAKEEISKLPWTNEDGKPVLHGCNKAILTRIDTYNECIDALARMCDERHYRKDFD